jgi:DNA-binding NarL/FixJ family response regulator
MKKIRLILVDDHEGFIRAVVRHLRRLEWVEVIGTAQDGQTAVAMVAEHKPDVVLMDMMMLGTGGLEATRLIKAAANPPTVILMSHFDDAEHRDQALRAGADQFVSKMSFLDDIATSLKDMASQLESGSSTNE